MLSPLALPSTRPPSCLPPSPPTDPRWCAANPEACKHLRAVDLTGAIGAKRLCSVASHDVDSEQAIDLCILGHGGVHLVFESEGTAAPLDSPSRLYVTVRGLGGRGRGERVGGWGVAQSSSPHDARASCPALPVFYRPPPSQPSPSLPAALTRSPPPDTQDVDSTCCVRLVLPGASDSQDLAKGERTPVPPGSTLHMGGEAAYQVGVLYAEARVGEAGGVEGR